jgi:hypothetical protein
MKSYVNITRGSMGEAKGLNAFRKRILDEKSDALKNNPDLNIRKDRGVRFNEWQLLDEDDNGLKQDDKNLYVSDWQMIN